MDFTQRRVVVAVVVALIAALARPGGAVERSTYQQASFTRYLMDRRAEIALARSAAPKSISAHATVLVLTRDGYETASRGANGFTCLVERSWMSPFDSREFWNASVRGPICYNPPAAGTILSYTLFRAKLWASGASKSQMLARINAAVSDKKLPLPGLGSMSYMMSKRQILGDVAGNWMSHVMIYAPKAASADAGASWGADDDGSPIMLDTSHHIVPEPETIFMIAAPHWSDGSIAPSM